MSTTLKKQGFLARLKSDISGNALPIIAASVIPVCGMIGAGVDFSRTYLSKTRLQQACDAGALAARKYKVTATTGAAVAANGNKKPITGGKALTQAQAYFNNNFPPGAFQNTGTSFNLSVDVNDDIVGSATSNVPTTLLQIFGIPSTAINVNCSSRLDIGNTDVALVLDITGSMEATLPDGKTRLAALRESVIRFYDTLGPGNASEGRVRYALIPYGQNVNLSQVVPTNMLIGGTGAATWTYQTRVANMNQPVYTGTPGTPTTLADEVYGGGTPRYITQNNCTKWGDRVGFTQTGTYATTYNSQSNPAISGGPAPTTTNSDFFDNNSTSGVDWGYAAGGNTSNKICRRRAVRTPTTYTLAGYERNSTDPWIYRAAPINVGNYAAGTAVNVYTGDTIPAGQLVPNSGQYDIRSLLTTPGSTVTGAAGGGDITSAVWDGCIEEVDTVNTITGSTSIASVPAGALDLDIDNIPSSEANTWRPAFRRASYWRDDTANRTSGTWAGSYGNYNGATGCPLDPARRLMEYASKASAPTENPSTALLEGNLSSFETYVNNLRVSAGTIHNPGFMWGARILSGAGIFAADNPDSWAGQPVARHLIFMTDGDMNVGRDRYDFQGINQLDQRVANRGTNDSSLNTIYNRRLRIACEAAKSRNITIWVIAFGEDNNGDGKVTSVDFPDLSACATSADNHFFGATDTDGLNGAYQRIASAISELRLVD